jgi:hypothetical protein
MIKIVGVVLLALPFVGISSLVYATWGWHAVVVVWIGVLLFLGCICGGTWLLSGES